MSYLAATLVVALLIGWIAIDYLSQTRRLRELDRSGLARRSGRSVTDIR
jgi:heme exporter protein D